MNSYGFIGNPDEMESKINLSARYRLPNTTLRGVSSEMYVNEPLIYERFFDIILVINT